MVSGHWAKSAVDRYWGINILWCSREYKEVAGREALDTSKLRLKERLGGELHSAYKLGFLYNIKFCSIIIPGYHFCIGDGSFNNGKKKLQIPLESLFSHCSV